jgi:hypothetical protein
VFIRTREMDKPSVCNDLGETVTQDTDQRCDQENVGHANEDKLDDGQLKTSPRTKKPYHERGAKLWIDLEQLVTTQVHFVEIAYIVHDVLDPVRSRPI